MNRGKVFAPDGSAGGAQPLTRQQRRQQQREARKTASKGNQQSGQARRDPQQQTQIAAAVKQATHHIKSGNYRAGLEIIENILRVSPDHAETLALKGNLAHVHGDNLTAIELFQRSIAVEPLAPYVHFNLGAVLVKSLRNKEAIEPLKRAIKLQPDMAQAHNALGGAYVGLFRFEEAKRTLRKALQLSGPAAPSYTNLGLCHLGLGETEKALACFTEALRLKANPLQLYDGIIPAAAKLALSDDPKDHAAWQRARERLQDAFPESPAPALLDYSFEKLEVDPAPDAIARAQRALTPVDEETQTLAAPAVSKPEFGAADPPARVSALLHFGRSATGLLHALIDGHPEVTTLPGVYFKGFFGPGVWNSIRHSDPDEMIRRFIDLYEVLFDARHPKAVPGNPSKRNVGMGIQEGFTNLGAEKDQALTLDRQAFRKNMLEMLAGRERLTQGDFFRLLHRAFERAQGRPGDEPLIFYHIHNPVPHEFLNFLRYFPDTQIMMMAREPIGCCESWISKDVTEELDYTALSTKLAHMPYHVSRPEFSGRDAFGIRLDDLKLKPEATMRALADRLGIDWSPSLLEPTMQGLAWWGDPGSKTFGLDPFDPAVLHRQIGTIFGERDQQLMRSLYYPFRVLYGWEDADESAFLAGLAEAKALLEAPMDCEQHLMDGIGMAAARFKENISYAYVRVALRSRLETLKKYGTYPGMIQPLRVDP